MEAQVKITDIIRENLMDYIYSDDSLNDACYIKEILLCLDDIDRRFEESDKEKKDMRRKIVERDVSIKKLEKRLEAATTISEEGV